MDSVIWIKETATEIRELAGVKMTRAYTVAE